MLQVSALYQKRYRYFSQLNGLVVCCGSVEEEGRLQSLSHCQVFFVYFLL